MRTAPSARTGFGDSSRCSDGEEVASAGVGARVTQLAHGPCFDLADALTGEAEVVAHLLECPRLATVETEAQA